MPGVGESNGARHVWPEPSWFRPPLKDTETGTGGGKKEEEEEEEEETHTNRGGGGWMERKGYEEEEERPDDFPTLPLQNTFSLLSRLHLCASYLPLPRPAPFSPKGGGKGDTVLWFGRP